MYKRDVPKIKEFVKEKGPEGLLRVITFVLCTIRTPISRVSSQCEDIKNKGENSKFLWGFKKKGYLYVKDNKEKLYATLDNTDEHKLMVDLVSVPGLGLAKAGFVAQCLGFNTACIDSHNLRRLKIDPKVLMVKKDVGKSVDRYLNLVQGKGPEWYWDTWCNYVAGNRYNKDLKTGDEVSSVHYDSISLTAGKGPKDVSL